MDWFRFWILMLVLFGVALFALPVKAQEMQRLAICDEAAHVEELAMAVIETNMPLNEYADTINKRIGSESCGVVVGAFIEIEKVKEVTIGGMKGHIIKVGVMAIFDGQRMMPVPNLIQYTVALTKVKGEDA